jgi:hypothetical protein
MAVPRTLRLGWVRQQIGAPVESSHATPTRQSSREDRFPPYVRDELAAVVAEAKANYAQSSTISLTG